jgi:hypothetical protein
LILAFLGEFSNRLWVQGIPFLRVHIISATFNVSNLSLFDVGDNSRSNPFKERGNDENQQAPLKDPLHVPVEPITRARSKKIKEALNGLILQRGIPSLAERKMKA